MTRPPWHGSTRKQRLPKEWPKLRAAVLKRDHEQCQWVREDTQRKCLLHANQADHITPGDDHRMTNLQALCEWHHQQKSSGEGGRSAATRRAKPDPMLQHPGIIH